MLHMALYELIVVCCWPGRWGEVRWGWGTRRLSTQSNLTKQNSVIYRHYLS